MNNDNEEESQPEARFNNHLKSNLIHLHKNLYINRTDPLYYEKILRYTDPKSSEAHYRLAQKYEKEGNKAKALFHYQEVANNKQTTTYYAKAKEQIRQLQRPAAINLPIIPLAPRKPRISYKKTPLFILMICNLILFFLLLNLEPLQAVVSKVMYGNAGIEVVYPTDLPYVIYIASDEANNKIETMLYTKAFEMGKHNPNYNIQLYGIKTTDPTLKGITAPLFSEQLKRAAFVIAQYNASVDQAVKIQFSLPLLTTAAANLVRTALQAYLNDNRAPPAHLESLINNYPNNYLSFIPNEILSGSNKVSDQFDGTGGWVYHPLASELSSMFYPNITDESTALQTPYSPVKLFISKKEHTLLVVTGSIVLISKPVGFGKENRTPEGTFTIQDRVLNPLGKHPNIYGKAGLSMGQYAIHGTFDETSILTNKSLGCIRISNADILALFPFVPKGAAVQISNDIPSAFHNALTLDNIHTLDNILTLDNAHTLEVNRLLPAKKPQINETPQNIIFNWLG